MNLIDFKNYPDTTTPVNADNLNLLQTNIENSIDDVENDITKYRVKRYDLTNVNLVSGNNSIAKPASVDTMRIINVVIYRGGNPSNAYYTSFNSGNIHIYSAENYSGCTLYIYYLDNI